MLKPLARDIIVTLIIKLILLISLWIICFKDVEKSHLSNEQWLLGVQDKEYLHSKEK
ncbi:cytochrome oxidase putative small subunit CydP [Legionella longbeachae]|uniref:Uncharacterized protein n=1 Tax=Legionella longbeachae serogroup 1 (strain NSW150) TaxID=661367 RepID=D3HKQ1_LEGLN|nr:cytochrome oxidase putative small subunit CydP [Legionella longbeachae]VEE03532.1 Uncharacterised protein [Legionella oakridgensis]HBD7397809.1 hypothetical protein [Legionella pneumophila]EEZ93853.1 conserved hypothetical protein [Legionella longbeachae D-4968]UAK46529.1 hypothetical protein K8O86_17525 [Legionella longbeachae]CBJ13017.1 conserved protein of unknown function [Legionella longbeachae NSW150]